MDVVVEDTMAKASIRAVCCFYAILNAFCTRRSFLRNAAKISGYTKLPLIQNQNIFCLNEKI